MYEVLMMPSAEAEADDAYLYIYENNPENAGRWYNGLVRTVLSLEDMPRRCPLVPENNSFQQEIRQLLYGNYRILFRVDDERKQVIVLHVRHGMRDHFGD